MKNRIVEDNKGFTLMELLIVMVILGILAAIVGPRFIDKEWKSRQGAAKQQISLFETAVDMYRLDVGKYPTAEQGLKALRTKPEGATKWAGPYLRKELPMDPWNKPYVYIYPGEHSDFDIMSLGADNSIGGEKENMDICSWKNVGD